MMGRYEEGGFYPDAMGLVSENGRKAAGFGTQKGVDLPNILMIPNMGRAHWALLLTERAWWGLG